MILTGCNFVLLNYLESFMANQQLYWAGIDKLLIQILTKNLRRKLARKARLFFKCIYLSRKYSSNMYSTSLSIERTFPRLLSIYFRLLRENIVPRSLARKTISTYYDWFAIFKHTHSIASAEKRTGFWYYSGRLRLEGWHWCWLLLITDSVLQAY